VLKQNWLLIQVESNITDVVVFNRRSVLIHYTLADTNLDLIIQQYSPAFVSLVLDTNWADCEFFPIDKLSLIDRFLLKRNLASRCQQEDKLQIGPLFIDEKARHNAELAREGDHDSPEPELFYERTSHDSKKFMVTTCDLSDSSKKILQQLTANHIPVRKMDILPRVIMQNARKRIPTKWACFVYKNAKYATISVSLYNKLVLVRDVMGACADEIIQTFQYLGRTAYANNDEITILQEDGLDVLDESRLLQELNCVEITTFSRRINRIKHFSNKCVRFLHNMYIWPKSACVGAVVLSSGLLALSLQNIYLANIEKQHQKIFKGVRLLPPQEVVTLEKQSSCKKNVELLWTYKASQSWSKQHMLDVSMAALNTAHKGQFLQSMNCTEKDGRMQIAIVLSPSKLHSGEPNAKNARKCAVLKNDSEIIADQVKVMLLQHFKQYFSTKATYDDINIQLNIYYDEHQASGLSGIEIDSSRVRRYPLP
jgi:hypothetical protein